MSNRGRESTGAQEARGEASPNFQAEDCSEGTPSRPGDQLLLPQHAVVLVQEDPWEAWSVKSQDLQGCVWRCTGRCVCAMCQSG